MVIYDQNTDVTWFKNVIRLITIIPTAPKKTLYCLISGGKNCFRILVEKTITWWILWKPSQSPVLFHNETQQYWGKTDPSTHSAKRSFHFAMRSAAEREQSASFVNFQFISNSSFENVTVDWRRRNSPRTMTVPSISNYCIVGWTVTDNSEKTTYDVFLHTHTHKKNFSHTCSQRFYLCILLFPCLLVNTLLEGVLTSRKEDCLRVGLSDNPIKQCWCVYYLCWYGNSLKKPHSSSDIHALDSISDKEGSSTWSAMLRKQLISVSCNENVINWLRQ